MSVGVRTETEEVAEIEAAEAAEEAAVAEGKEEIEEEERMEANMTALQEELKDLGMTDEVIAAVIDFGVESLEDVGRLKEGELVEFGMKPMKARKLLEKMKAGSTEVVVPVATGAPMAGAVGVTPVPMVQGVSLLPDIPSDDAWLAALKVGGVLKVGKDAYLSAMRATLASETGIYAAPGKIIKMMEQFAIDNGEQVPNDFFEMSKMLTRRNYGEIFAAIDADGKFVTEDRKKVLIAAMKKYVWPQLAVCHVLLKSWYDTYCQMNSNPMALVNAIRQAPGIGNQAPDASFLRDAGDTLRDGINRALAGVGTIVASAMAYDYTKIRDILLDRNLPSKVGMANREQMFKQLDLKIDANLARLENSLTRFLLAFVELENLPMGTEANYLAELYLLGSSINWTGIGVDLSSASGLTQNSGLTNLGGDSVERMIREANDL